MGKLSAIIFILLLIMPLALALPVKDAKLTGYINDYTGTLTEQDTQQLSMMAKTFQDYGVAQIAILFVDNFDGLSKEEYAIAVAHEKLGTTKEDNGLLLLVGIEPREFRIEVGYGLEGDLNDAKVGRIAREQLIPDYANNDYATGTGKFLRALQLELLPSDAPINSNSPYIVNEQQSSNLNSFYFYIGIFLFTIILRGINAARNHKKGKKYDDNDVDNAFTGAILASMFLRPPRGGMGGMGGGFGGFGGGGFGGGGFGGNF